MTERLLKLCELWQRTSAKSGKTYYSGFMGDLSILMFDAGERSHPTRPDEVVHVWRLFAQERDATRRPGANAPTQQQGGARDE